MKIRNYERDRQNTIKYSARKPKCNKTIVCILKFRNQNELFSLQKYLNMSN